ncbi:MAG: hypothetical protein P1U40_03220 [Coxiellaceae bacterium]|nr:hypothetical protein [Coxiellaceae bacterium]
MITKQLIAKPARRVGLFCSLSSVSLVDTRPTFTIEEVKSQFWYKHLVASQPQYGAPDFLQKVNEQPVMTELVDEFGLGESYPSAQLQQSMKLIGFHGTSVNSAPVLFPSISTSVRNLGLYHSANDPKNQCLHIADSLAAAIHYANINSVSLSSYRSGTHFDPGIIFLVFTALATAKDLKPLTRRSLIGHDYKKCRSRQRGHELLVPKGLFSSFCMLPLYKTPPKKRMTPLKDNDVVYVDGEAGRWSKGAVRF